MSEPEAEAANSGYPKTKDADRNLIKLQTLLSDAAALLITRLEAARKGSLTTRDAAESAQLTLIAEKRFNKAPQTGNRT